MENFPRITATACWLFLLIASFLPSFAAAAETNSVPAVTNAVVLAVTNDPAVVERQLRHYLKLQEQLHATLLAIEQARMESSLEARTNAELLATRIEQLERALAQQREQQLQASKESGNIALWIGGGIVAIGLVALAFSMFFQTRGVNRLAQVADDFQRDRALLGPLAIGGGSSERFLLGNGGNGNTRTLLTTIERLERRVEELEGTASAEEPDDRPSSPTAVESTAPVSTARRSRAERRSAENRPADQASVLLGKGNVLLSLGKAEEALACFDQAAAASPNRAEAHLRRGMALERLRKLDEAVTAYDRAITLNKSLTQAYLSKGGIYNQLERFNEALECYEQALKSEAKS